MEKRSETVAFKTTPTIEAFLRQISAIHGITLSDYMDRLAAEAYEREKSFFLKLSGVFAEAKDLPGLPGLPGLPDIHPGHGGRA